MSLLLQIGILSTLTVVVWQDFKWRAISVWVLLALIALTVADAFFQPGWYWKYTLINAVLVFIQLLLIKLWFSLKAGKNIRFRDHLMGIGDLVFFVAPCFFLNTLTFMVYYVVSLVLIALGYLVWKGLSGNRTDSFVPLAGGMAITMCLVMILGWIFPAWDRYDDFLLLEKLGLW